eukprot:scaffold139221_cov35-Tisochrysis_lutea.AAC.2
MSEGRPGAGLSSEWEGPLPLPLPPPPTTPSSESEHWSNWSAQGVSCGTDPGADGTEAQTVL